MFHIMKFYLGCIHFLLVQQCQYISYETLRMVRLDDYNILQPRHFHGSKLRGMYDLISV
jgi:hypothetical protein